MARLLRIGYRLMSTFNQDIPKHPFVKSINKNKHSIALIDLENMVVKKNITKQFDECRLVFAQKKNKKIVQEQYNCKNIVIDHVKSNRKDATDHLLSYVAGYISATNNSIDTQIFIFSDKALRTTVKY